MNDNKNYEPIKIPEQSKLVKTIKKAGKKAKEIEEAETKEFFSEKQGFIDIDVEGFTNDYSVETISKSQAIQPIETIQDEKHKAFVLLRQTARDNFSMRIDDSRIFYKQAVLMQDFEDDYTEQVPYSVYYANYQFMNYEQFRTYFTWRTKIRNREITDISIAYAFVYIYELINNIGVTDPQDGLEKLLGFWKAFRVYNPSIDKYVLEWIKDYHVYYSHVLSKSFKDFAYENNIQNFYPNIFGYESYENDNLELFYNISKYDVRNSVFWNEENKELFKDSFVFVIYKLREELSIIGINFDEFIFQSVNSEKIWTPFSNAMFYQHTSQPDKQVTLSKKEIYICRRNLWSCRSVVIIDNGSQFIGYIMKKTECELRKIVKFRYKLSANPKMISEDIAKLLEQKNVSLDKLIGNAVLEFHSNKNKKVVSVDKSILEKVRQQALIIQEKLIVEENNNENTLTIEPIQPATKKIEIKIETQIEKQYVNESISEEHEEPVSRIVSDEWTEFKDSLTETELNALSVMLSNGDIKRFSDENNIMMEVLIDSINQKAYDIISDNILEFGDEIEIYQEYREKLIKITEKLV